MTHYEWLNSLDALSWSIEVNEHRCMYETAAQAIANMPENFADTSPERIAKMIETNSIVALRIYPRTPVCFWIAYGPTLRDVMDYAMQEYEP